MILLILIFYSIILFIFTICTKKKVDKLKLNDPNLYKQIKYYWFMRFIKIQTSDKGFLQKDLQKGIFLSLEVDYDKNLSHSSYKII